MTSYKSVLAGKYPAKAHAQKVVEYMKQQQSNVGGILYLEGQRTRMHEDNDQAQTFRQRRYFYYLTGCDVPDCHLIYDISTSKSTLFIPPLSPDEVIWSGLPLSPSEALSRYDVDDVRPSTEVNSFLVSLPVKAKTAVWAIENQVSDHVTFLEFDRKDFALVKEAIEESRVVKDQYEIALTRRANEVTADAHKAVLKAARHAKNEQELEGLFVQRCMAEGCHEQAYPSIVASGENAATLHYQNCTDPLEGRWNLLVDAGAEYHCYASDVTRTFPLTGSFNKESRQIYDAVLRMQAECIEMLKDGVLWDDVHSHAHKVAIDALLEIGILKGGTADEIFKARTSVAFFPHGLGHYLGMDTHDTGGHPNYNDKDSLFKYLRVRGKLPAGSIITVEPGIYFCRFIIEPYLKNPAHAKYIDQEVLNKYWAVGGVRIEDNVLITKDGYENLTTAVKEREEVESLAKQ
ncbi:MAG: hypothetical protein M4579_003903 [Chaenotheca gracillima]|nr:MAG: hypothetical protein M4579_003903 [Chaenotheca gracillima]